MYSTLCESDIRAVVRLLGAISILEVNLSEKRRYLLDGFCELIDGDQWDWILERKAKKNPACLERMSGVRHFALSSLSSLGVNLPHATQLKDFAGAGEPVKKIHSFAIQYISRNVVSSIRISRRKDRSPFALREIEMAEIVLSEIPWLHGQDSSIEAKRTGLGLSPRQRATLVHLINGLSRKDIAEQLHLSAHTVHGYIKAIFKYYEVNSRSELMRQLTLGRQPES